MPKEAIAENARLEDVDEDEIELPDFESSTELPAYNWVIYDFTCPECNQRFIDNKKLSKIEEFETFWRDNPVECGPAHGRKGETVRIPLKGQNLADLL
jgi:hypothetical protein